jgi:hypothetical protein
MREQEDDIMSAQENEKEAVRTTIVGGRPPGSGRSNVTVPRGIEVLVKKAAVDPEFRKLLFEQRGGAAAAIELELDPAENAVLSAIPREQLVQIVSQTTVPMEQRRVFLGRIAAAMLAVLGVGLTGCEPPAQPAGVRADLPPTEGIRPDRPKSNTPKSPVEPAPAGVRPDPPPSTNSPSTNKPPSTTRGIQPDRPKSDATNATVQWTLGIRPD